MLAVVIRFNLFPKGNFLILHWYTLAEASFKQVLRNGFPAGEPTKVARTVG